MGPGPAFLRAVALWAMFSPFFLLCLIAPGVMPARAESGVVMLVICDSYGATEIAVDARSFQPVEKAPGQGSEPCFWACLQGPVMLAAPVTLTPLAMRLLAVAPPPAAMVVLAMARATGLPPATGPPAV